MSRRQPVPLTGDAVMIKSKSTRSSSFGRLYQTATSSQSEMSSTASRSTRSDELNDTMPASINRKLVNVSPLYLSLAVTYAHVFLSPYTKVEESFTLHAVHDVLAYGHTPGHLSKVCPLSASRANTNAVSGIMSPFPEQCQDPLSLQFCLVASHTHFRLWQSTWAGFERS